MGSPIISLITPCYNVESTLERYLNSVLNQTYKKIELIAIDDGSIDNTKNILLKYKDIFDSEGMKLIYVYQKNSGLGSAINTGLKYVTGKYLTWADPDDFFEVSSFEKRMKILEENYEIGVVSSNAAVYKDCDLKHPIKYEADRFEHRYEDNQFLYLLTEQSHFCAGCHMIRMEYFDKVVKNREIYPARRGQNWQLLLPIYYCYKRYYLDEPLYAYIVYDNSMSSGDDSEIKELDRWNEHETIIRETLKRISLKNDEILKLNHIITARYALKKFYTAIDYRDKALLKEQYIVLRKLNRNTKEIDNLYLRNYYVILKIFYKIKELVKL